MNYTRDCIICGKEFSTNYDRKKCCCGKCSIENRKRVSIKNAKKSNSMKQRIEELEFKLQQCKNVMTEEQLIKLGF